MLQVRNETPFTPGLFLFPDERGVDTVYVALKATFLLREGGRLAVAEQQRPLVMKDEYWGEPGASSLKYASEAHLLKPGTDVVLVGEAHAPRRQPVDTVLVSVQVGPLRQVLQVIGDRQWKGGLFSPSPSTPEPFLTLPLTWERAYGGTHAVEGQVLADPRNPVGQGFRGRRGHSEMVGRPLPNVENPHHLISSISDTPMPVGVGPVASSWEPRKGCAGTYDEAWRKRRAPYLPKDFNPEFFQVAPAALRARQGLKGGEPVHLQGLSSAGVERFSLPRCEWEVSVKVDGQWERPMLRLETVLLEPGAGRVCMTWRGSVECDKRALRVQEARFRVQQLKGVEG